MRCAHLLLFLKLFFSGTSIAKTNDLESHQRALDNVFSAEREVIIALEIFESSTNSAVRLFNLELTQKWLTAQSNRIHVRAIYAYAEYHYRVKMCNLRSKTLVFLIDLAHWSNNWMVNTSLIMMLVRIFELNLTVNKD